MPPVTARFRWTVCRRLAGPADIENLKALARQCATRFEEKK